MAGNKREICRYDGRYNSIIGKDFPERKIIQSDGLLLHIKKRHPGCVKYVEKIKDIILNSDYVGLNPKENDGFELVKIYDGNVLLGIKLDSKNDYYYVATLYKINNSKLERRKFSGRLKKVNP